ncbi:hypothetical protein [Bradyrhizobium niftali]|uniref:hypothetical protein n=1 Tax=Bradyrhizobium niftali TaxID=2560055 RepID=UPI001073B4AF|nr:hypothetical protein [Bradyrhizobium niftali]
MMKAAAYVCPRALTNSESRQREHEKLSGRAAMGRITSCIPADRHGPSGPYLVTSRSRFPVAGRVNVGAARERDEAYLHLVYGLRDPLI